MSLKGDKYETIEEIQTRISDSVVFYDGEPVYITDVSRGLAEEKPDIARVFFRKLPYAEGGEKFRKYLSSKKFDLATPRMGYMNEPIGRSAIFVSRAPVRQYKQGLNPAVIRFHMFSNHEQHAKNLIPFDVLVKNQGFADMLVGKYPAIEEVLDMLEANKWSSAALSHHFALSRDNNLDLDVVVSKGIQCGIIQNGKVKFSRKFHFLKDDAEDSRIPIV